MKGTAVIGFKTTETRKLTDVGVKEVRSMRKLQMKKLDAKRLLMLTL